jgi:predicted Fe-Mo cluster-binding NifX family protein
MPRLVIPIERFEGENSKISWHFGRAPLFALIEFSEDGSMKSISSVENTGQHFAGHGIAESIVSNLEPHALIVKGIGPRALQAFQDRGVLVYRGDVDTVGEAVHAYLNRRLIGLTEPCKEARHSTSYS